MANEKLTYQKLSRQRRDFVDAYLKQGFGRGNASEAARTAGYSEKTARQQGSRLLSDADIQAAIAERVNEMKIAADEVLLRMAAIARGSLGEFITVEGEVWYFDIKKAAEADKLGLLKKLKRTVKENGDETVEIELHDAQTALATLMRHLGLLGPAGGQGDPLNVEVKLTADQFAPLFRQMQAYDRQVLDDSDSAE